MIRWLYQSEGGGIYFDVGIGVARCISRKKMFIGEDQSIKEQIVKWLETFCGKLNYVSIVSNKTFTPISDEEIEVNLKRYKRSKEIQLHIAQRPAGAYDVIHEVISNPYATSRFTVWSNKRTFTISDKLPLQEIEKKITLIFKEEGYYKVWRKESGQRSIAPGIASVPVWHITYCAP